MAYTFKDDGSRLTYFREYNKEVGTGDKTLVGNWVEERALRESVETGRYKMWTNPDPDPKAQQQTFTKFTTRPDTLDTYRRTVVHSDVRAAASQPLPPTRRRDRAPAAPLAARSVGPHGLASARAPLLGSGSPLAPPRRAPRPPFREPPTRPTPPPPPPLLTPPLPPAQHTPSDEFLTSNQVRDPGYAVYVNPAKGARERLLEERAYSMAKANTPAEPVLPPQYQSTYKQDFTSKDLPASDSLGRRVMMTQNMQDIKGAGDGLWRKESNTVSRHLVVERTEGEPNQTFTQSGTHAARAFGKDATFSTPISIYVKGEEKD